MKAELPDFSGTCCWMVVQRNSDGKRTGAELNQTLFDKEGR